MPIYHKVAQRSEEWFLRRLGIPTASEFDKIITPKEGRLSAQAAKYMHWLLAEQMLGRLIESEYQSEYMRIGQEGEDQAIDAYEFLSGETTEPGGFITTDDGLVGCSPDRIVGEDGLLEMKIPAPQTHIGYLLSPDLLKEEKRVQVQGQLYVSGREWCDLVSCRLPLPTVVKRVYRDEPYIDKMQQALDAFCATMQDLRRKLEAEHGPFPAIVLPKDRPRPADSLGVSDADVDAMIAQGLSFGGEV